MSLDNLVIDKLVNNIVKVTKNSFVSDVIKISSCDYALYLHGSNNNDINRNRTSLVISMNTRNPLIALTDEKLFKVTDSSTLFVSLKKLIGCKLVDIFKLKGERIVTFKFKRDKNINFDTDTETGYFLVVELFGNHPNLILISEQSNKIINLYHEKGEFISENYVGKNTEYFYPPERKNLSECTSFFEAQTYLSNKTYFYLDQYGSLEINKDVELSEIFKKVEESPSLYVIKNTIQPFHFEIKEAYPINEKEVYSFFNENQKKVASSLKEEKLKKELERLVKVNHKKLKNMENDLSRANNNLVFAEYGNLLLAYQYELNDDMYLDKKSKDCLVIEGYEIPLDKSKSITENAESYFKKYHKAKQAISILSELIEKVKNDCLYLDNKLLNFQKGEQRDIAELKEELVLTGYLKSVKKNKKSNKTTSKNNLKNKTSSKTYKPHVYKTPYGNIYFGMNDLQNESLTFKLASKGDYFVHIKDYPGSHIIIKGDDFNRNEKAILEHACKIALFLSDVSSGEVYYTRITKVKRNPAKLGLVNIKEYKTVYEILTLEDIEYIKKNID